MGAAASARDGFNANDRETVTEFVRTNEDLDRLFDPRRYREMSGILDKIAKDFPNGIPMVDKPGVLNAIKTAADNVDLDELDEDVEALIDARAKKDDIKAILAIVAMAGKAGLEIVVPG